MKQKPESLQKLQSACALAKSRGQAYIWIITYCIDKRSSAELSEAINSMFAVQRPRDARSGTDGRVGLKSRTGSDLIAPSEVEFFAHDWSPIGDRSDMALVIAKACQVDAFALLAAGVNLGWVSVARKMYWASNRATTREENMAYCLLGLFDVNMPLVYGEGTVRAFQRLQEEIIKRSGDQSIYA
ncbi:hypothetical protein B0H67DRAFT_640777 [Lasiosphaeris hirsuta]|uniref:DUF8212 domain-containing protein n=1 Tax=Lasiosphaeris hirsuta TaxID=260670 RepID=A0AA40AYB8_9PEZI|nr:hypothetical protein B0H67DRAFT_640777 [Lasiosphaeris hirsuta]